MENIEVSQKSPRQEQRDELYQKVEQKVNYILEARKFAADNATATLAEVRERADLKVKEVESCLGPEVVTKLRRCHDLEAEIVELEREFDENESLRLSERIMELEDELNLLSQDTDLVFLENMRRFYRFLPSKKKSADLERENIEAGKNSLVEKFLKQHGLTPQDVTLDYSGFSVNLILQPDDFERIFNSKGWQGVHLRQSPLNIIEGGNDEAATIRHEENHNLSEAFLGESESMYVKQFISLLSRRVEGYKELKGMPAPEGMLIHRRQMITRLVEKYAQQNFHEIIADVDNIAEGRIWTFVTNFLKAFGQIQSFADREADLEVQEMLDGQIEKMGTNFLHYISRLSSIFFVASKAGKLEEAKALTILFRPEEIIKAERQMKRYTPDFDAYQGLRPLLLNQGSYFSNLEEDYQSNRLGGARVSALRELGVAPEQFGPTRQLLIQLVEADKPQGFFDPSRLEKLHQICKSGHPAPELNPQDRSSLEESIGRLTDKDFMRDSFLDRRLIKDFPDYQKVEKVLTLDEYLHDLADWLDLPKLKNFVPDVLAPALFDFILAKAFELDNFSLAEELFNKWTLPKDALIERLLDFYLSFGDAYHSYEEYHHLRYNKITIKQSNFWRFLEKMNLAGEAEKYL